MDFDNIIREPTVAVNGIANTSRISVASADTNIDSLAKTNVIAGIWSHTRPLSNSDSLSFQVVKEAINRLSVPD